MSQNIIEETIGRLLCIITGRGRSILPLVLWLRLAVLSCFRLAAQPPLLLNLRHLNMLHHAPSQTLLAFLLQLRTHMTPRKSQLCRQRRPHVRVQTHEKGDVGNNAIFLPKIKRGGAALKDVNSLHNLCGYL